MNRALRRHPVTTKQKARPAGGRLAPPRPAPAKPLPRREGRSGLAALAGWRPRFVMDIITELRKVVWPSRQDTIHLTMVVVVVAVIMGAILGSIDVGFGWLIDRILLR